MLNSFAEFFAKLTFTEGVLVFLIFFGGLWIYKSHNRQLDDRQKELDRLAKDNHRYRDRFEQMQDRIERLNDRLERQSTKAGERP